MSASRMEKKRGTTPGEKGRKFMKQNAPIADKKSDPFHENYTDLDIEKRRLQ